MILCKVIRNTWASITYYFFRGVFFKKVALNNRGWSINAAYLY